MPLASFAGCSADGVQAVIVINEIVSSNSRSLTDSKLGSPDWVELFNGSDEDVDLTGYRLTDKMDSLRGVFAGGIVPAGGYLVVCSGKSGAQCDPGHYSVDFNISKNGEELYLVTPQNKTVAKMAVPALLTDFSWARRADRTYGVCARPTPGARNDDICIYEPDELQARLKAGKLAITEVMPKPAEGHAWAELRNEGQTELNLADFCLTDDPNDPMKWIFPEKTIQPGEYAVVYLTGDGEDGAEMRASFKLGNKDEVIYLNDIAGNPVDSLSWENGMPKGVSVVRGGRYTYFSTPGSENSERVFSSLSFGNMDASDPVRLSEVLPKNKYSVVDGDGDRTEWAELYNDSGQAVSLSGYYLSDDSGDLLKWAFPDVIIEAESYLIVFLSGKAGKTGELHASFRLSRGETGLYLTNIAGMRQDALALPHAIGENISVGRAGDGSPVYYAQPTPGYANAVGFADPALTGRAGMDGVYISEVCAANKAKSGVNDWVELHNGSALAVDLSGYYLSDDASRPRKWQIPSLQIDAGGYAVIEASSDPARRKADTACFGISPAGDTLLLSDADGALVDAFETGVLSPGITSGRLEGGGAAARVFFPSPTRGQPNQGEAFPGYAAEPVFSENGLYHAQAFSLSIVCTTPDARIYYTTDGSEPTDASTAYAGPLLINKNTPIRAVAYADGLLPGAITTRTYLFEAPHTVPVFCITGKPSDMKILIHTDRRNYRPEFEACVEYYETSGSFGVTFPAGVHPKGQSSLLNPQNSLTMSLRSNYGQSSVTYPFFSGSSVKNFTDLTLRNAGQDFRNARIRDPYFQAAAKGMNVDGTETKTVVAYVNGVYCGVYDLSEEQNDYYAASHYGLDAGDIDMIERSNKTLYGDNKEFLRINEMARTWDMKDDKVFAEFSNYVDVDACTDYLIARIYFGDGDVQNMRFWRAQDYSVKWRPLLFDLDWSFRPVGVSHYEQRNVFNKYFKPNVVAGNGTVTDNYIFCALMKNKAWCDKFTERFVQLAEMQFSPERMLGIFDGMLRVMEPEMQMHIDRWHTPKSMAVWLNETGKLRSALEKRQKIALQQMQRYFRVSDARMRELTEKYSPA
jgi:hypothetical protein